MLHVSSDDVEAVIHAVTFALEYRNKFNRDVFIDLLGYRKYGHNEGDEPRFTQPKLYKYISGHPNPRDICTSKLIDQKGIINDDHVSKIELEYFSKLEAELTDSKKKQKTRLHHSCKKYGKDLQELMRKKCWKIIKQVRSKKIYSMLQDLLFHYRTNHF